MEAKNQAVLRKIVYVVIFVVTSLPLACAYVMEGGDILIWLARIEEVKENLQAKHLLLYPSAELTVVYGGQFCALNSNLWLFIPAIIRILGGSITVTYRLYMLLLNMITILAAYKMFREIFEDKASVLFGVLFYMTCPYRMYICYDKANLGMVAAWSLIPLAAGGMIRVFQASASRKNVLVIAGALAAIGYADGMLLLFSAGCIILGSIWYRKPQGLIPLGMGVGVFLPGAVYWLRYVLGGGMEEWSLPIRSVADRGYVLGQFFTSWVYRLDCPGLGLGLMIGLTVFVWSWCTGDKLPVKSKCGFRIFIMCFLALMSLKSFPWDIVQRLGNPLLRLVSLMETPGICFGFVSLAACVLGALGIACAMKHRKLFVKAGIPLIAAFAALGVAIYICNSLTYYRVPMFLTEYLPI